MQKLQTSIFINASREKVWDIMLGAETYTQWTKVFNPTSRFEGDWSEGSKMLFIGTDENGKHEAGMVSRIVENRPHEYISIEHLGFVQNGEEDITSENIKEWIGAHENYTFIEKDGGTEVVVELDVPEAHMNEFEDMWSKALQDLKKLAEE